MDTATNTNEAGDVYGDEFGSEGDRIEAGSPEALYRAVLILADEVLHIADHIPVLGFISNNKWRTRFCNYVHSF